MSVNPCNVLRLLMENYEDYPSSELSIADRELADLLKTLIDNRLKPVESNCLHDDTELVSSEEADESEEVAHNDSDLLASRNAGECFVRASDEAEGEEDDDMDVHSSQSTASSSSEYVPEPSIPAEPKFVDYPYKKRAVDYWRSGPNGKKRTVQNVANRFRRLKHPGWTLRKWARQVDAMYYSGDDK